MGEFISWFKDLSKKDVLKVGGKGAQLGEMSKLGVPVPQGFCVTVNAYRKFLEESGVGEEIYAILDELDVNDNERLQTAEERIYELIMGAEIPDDIVSAIKTSYNNMNIDIDVLKMGEKINMIKAGRDLSYVAIRSSANAEDQPETSFAGQNKTFLNIKGADHVVEAVKECWASLFSARCIFYKVKNNLEHRKVLISAVVQKMVNADSAGVAFTINPTTNNKDEIVIEAGFGLGESVVSGSITPDVYLVNKSDFNIIDKVLNEQKEKIVLDINLGRSVTKRVLEGKVQKVRDAHIKEIAQYAKKLEEHYKMAQDIEFAIEGNRVYIVQTRPVTTEGKVEAKVEEREEVEGVVIVKGIAAGPGIGKGKVKIVHNANELSKIEQGDVLVAEMTNPDYVSAMKRAIAVVTDEGGSSCHAAIVGREMGLAVVVGTGNGTEILKEGMQVTVDGYTGKVYSGEVEIEKPVEEVYEEVAYETITKVKVNLDMPEYAEKAKETGADGVGLLRAEFLILKDKEHPYFLIKNNRKEELVNDLADGIKKIAEAFRGKPVWYRTLDAPTDEFRHMKGGEDEPKEDNPMMGWRSIRRDLDQPELLKAQLEAIKKVNETGLNVGVMIPLVSNIEQVRKAKEYIKEVGLECEFGVMIETPGAVGIIEDICKEGLDFISFGTNDLTQFTLAVDRNNEKVQNLFDEMHPAVLKQMRSVIKVCKEYNVETSICGQAGSRSDMVEWLVKNGIDSVSANIDAVKRIRHVVSKVERKLLLDAARKG